MTSLHHDLHVRFYDAADAVYEIVREGEPEFKYTVCPVKGCSYVHSDTDGTLTAGCIVGQVLVRLGVPVEFFVDQETGNGLYGALASIRERLAQNGVTFTDRAFSYLNDLQFFQDQGAGDGEARTP